MKLQYISNEKFFRRCDPTWYSIFTLDNKTLYLVDNWASVFENRSDIGHRYFSYLIWLDGLRGISSLIDRDRAYLPIPETNDRGDFSEFQRVIAKLYIPQRHKAIEIMNNPKTLEFIKKRHKELTNAR